MNDFPSTYIENVSMKYFNHEVSAKIATSLTSHRAIPLFPHDYSPGPSLLIVPSDQRLYHRIYSQG